MVAALFDTNILIDHLQGFAEARDEIARYHRPAISIVTWMEILVGASGADERATREFLQRFEIMPIDGTVAQRAVDLRRRHRIKLPDALIWATAQIYSSLLVTRNAKDFPEEDPGIRFPYVLE